VEKLEKLVPKEASYLWQNLWIKTPHTLFENDRG
jgi:hypothetical protein